MMFVDDIVKALSESEQAESAPKPEPANATVLSAAAPTKNTTAAQNGNAPKAANSTQAQKEEKDDSVPMDTQAIKAYSTVIADAAEESEPEKPVVYTETDMERTEAERNKRRVAY